MSLFLAGTGAVRADEFTARANASYGVVPQPQRSDLILLPVIAKMDAVPRAVSILSQAALLPADAASFADAAAWAQRPAQQAVLAALETATKERERNKSFAWGLPYGVEDVPTDLVVARLYTELGDPPTLASARHYWIVELEKVACLVNVEATRLAADGKPTQAVDLMIRWACLSRQIVERKMFAEVKWGMTHMVQALERVRDIAYTDFRGQRQLDQAKIFDQIKDVSPESILSIGQLKFPDGDQIAVEQVAARVFAGKRADPDRFGGTMARLGSVDFPLRLFSESERWRRSAALHASGPDTDLKIRSVFLDYKRRWNFDWFDRALATPTEYSKLGRTRFALITRSMPDMKELQDLRQMIAVEMIGTRLSLAIVGYTYANKSLPPQLTGVRPRWVERIPSDPFSQELDLSLGTKQRRVPEYILPPREADSALLQMDIVPAEGSPFLAKIPRETPILYSVGSDNTRQQARRVQNTTQLVQGADYLIWPPVISLNRQYLRDAQLIK
jgi:hypothetical protein